MFLLRVYGISCALLIITVLSGCGSTDPVAENPPPSGLTYSVNPAVYTVGTAIPSNTPSSSGGAVLRYSVSPPLPAGLSLDSSTGVISGTPTSVAPATAYVVTASNSVGSASTGLSISVSTDLPPPSGLTYSVNPAVYAVGTAISTNAPSSSGGAVATYSISPALSAGLNLNTATGVISGTPTAVTPAAAYVVTATNVAGSATAGLSITVSTGVVPPTSACSKTIGPSGVIRLRQSGATTPLAPVQTCVLTTAIKRIEPSRRQKTCTDSEECSRAGCS